MSKISIVIPTYNRAQFLQQSVSSALSHDFDDMEVVVVDDGSTDHTQEVISGFSDARVKYIYQHNQGASFAFNTGIKHSSGDYISILGSDDWYLPNGLTPLAQELDRRPEIGVIAGGYIFVDEDGNKIKEAFPWEQNPDLGLRTWLFECPVLSPAALFRRYWVEKIGGYDTSIKIPQDWDFGIRLAHAGCPMAWVKSLIFCYRLHGNNSMRNTDIIKRDVFNILEKVFAMPDLPLDITSLKNAAYGLAYLRSANRGYISGDFEAAKSDLARAIDFAPDLLSNRGDRLIKELVGVSRSPLMFLKTDPKTRIHTIWNNLPEQAAEIRRYRRKALAEVAALQFFEAYREQDWPGVRRQAVAMFSNDLHWALNSGVRSICLESILGSELTGRAKRFWRGVAGALSNKGDLNQWERR